MTVGDRIRIRRMELGLSLRDLADRMEYNDHSTISRIEKGVVKLSHTRIEQFAEALDVPVEYLLKTNENSLLSEKDASLCIGDRVKKRRLELGLSQDELATKMGYQSRTSINKIENGRAVTQKIAIRLAAALDVSASYLMGLDGDGGSAMTEPPVDSRDVFAGNLRMSLAKSGKTRQEVCQEIGVNYSTFSEWCNGRKYPRIENIELLAEYFGVTVSELVGNEDSIVEADSSDNKAVLSENLRFYMKKSGKMQKDVAQVIGVSAATFNDWMKGKKYPRIEKIELLAKYFGVTKTELIEKHSSRMPTEQVSDSREAFASNLRFYMAKTNKSRKEISEAIGMSYFTFSDWCNGKKYPRIEKLEAMAKYFGISVPELVGEQKQSSQRKESPEIGKDEVLDIILRLHTDAEFLKIVEKMSALDSEKLKALQQFLQAFGE